MPRRNTARRVLAITAAAVTLLTLVPASAPAGDRCWYGFGVGFGMHGGGGGGMWPAPVGGSGYDPFVLDHRTGKFRYVPIPYDPEPRGSGYNPYRFNWHSERWDYVPLPIEQDYRLWQGAAANETQRAAGSYAASVIERPSAPAATPARNPVMATDLAASRATQTTAVSRAIPPVPPPTPPRMMPSGTKPTTRPTLTRRLPAQGGDAGWTRVRGVTGRWDYDYQRGRWVFVLPSD